MSQKKKFKPANPAVQPLLVGIPAATGVPAKEQAQIKQLIANGKHGVAVDIAKQVHKRMRNAASEELLVDAYVARIQNLGERNLDKEASALLERVRAEHPACGARLCEAAATLKARTGEIEALLELLAAAELPAEARTSVELAIRGAAYDPGRIASCDVLPPEHPLRIAAAAVARALEAVTSGPAAPETLALPEISRQSPLAPWKMMVRAIAAFYGGDHALCEKCLASVELGAGPARLVPALRALLGDKQAALTPAARELIKQVGGGDAALETALAHLDQALDKKNVPLALQEIERAVALCKDARPEVSERLLQHISIRAMAAGAKVERVTAAMGGPSLKNAYFWRLRARQEEDDTSGDARAIPAACSFWEEFRRHAVHEKWMPARGPEAATLYLHMADLWRRIPEDQAEFVAGKFASAFRGHGESYVGQPAPIRALAPPPRSESIYYLDPDVLLERACEADPCAENFQRWLNRAKEDPGGGDRVAERWAAALPQDIPPVLHLMHSAERTNALKRAYTLMEKAERIDGLNPEVRKARLRLLISLATRHLQQKKVHLADPELRQLEALPHAGQGDRPALLAALRWVFWTVYGDMAKADAARVEAARVLASEPGAQILLRAVAAACRFKGKMPVTAATNGPLAAAFGRVCAVGQDAGLPIEIPRGLSKQLLREVSGAAVDAASLLPLGEAAVRAGDLGLAYGVSAAGLKHAKERWAEFLFLRAQALPGYEGERQQICAAAASELARRQRNLDLLRRIGEWREEEMPWFEGEKRDVVMSTGEIESLVGREIAETAYPSERDDMDFAGSDCNCPACRAAAKGGMPPMPPELERLMDELGPEEMIRQLAQILGGGAPKGKKRRSRPPFGDDVPF